MAQPPRKVPARRTHRRAFRSPRRRPLPAGAPPAGFAFTTVERVGGGGGDAKERRTMPDTLNVGIIGAGNMGTTHARCWARLPDARVAAVADVQIHKARALAERVGGTVGSPAEAFADAHALLARPDVHAVSICVPTPHHRSLTEAAARAGKHVLCEKPMALTLADCDAMIAATRTAGVTFLVGHVVRFFPEYARARALIESGAVGRPAAVRVRRGGSFPVTDTDWYADPAQSGGVPFDLLVHDFDWLRWCFGPVTRVFAKGLTERLAGREMDHLDYTLATLRHRNGVISHAEGTWADPGGFVTTFEVAGDAGLLEHDSRKAGVLTQSLRRDAANGEGAGAGVAVPRSPLAEEDDPYFREIAHFARCVQTAKRRW
jgi:predicted dehydrogenase